MTFCDPLGCGCCTSRSSAPDVHPGPGRAIQLSMGGCSFMPMSFKKNIGCEEASLLLRKIIEFKKVDKIILVTNQYKHLSYLSEDQANKNIDYFIDIIAAALKNNIKVVYFTPRPSFKLSVARAALKQGLKNPISINQKYQNLIDDRIQSIQGKNFTIFDQRNIIISKLCSQPFQCNDGLVEGRPFYRDTNHLSKYGAEYVFSKLDKN